MKIADFVEENGYKLLQKLPDYSNIKRHNQEIKTNPDYINGESYGDCQYSTDFGKWGDLRIDVISAYHSKFAYKKLQNLAKEKAFNFTNFKSFLNSLVVVKKFGKIYNIIDFIVYFLYKAKVNSIDDAKKPQKIYILDSKKAVNAINDNWKEFVETSCLRFNSKFDTFDNFGSAFIAISPDKLSNCLTDISYLIE